MTDRRVKGDGGVKVLAAVAGAAPLLVLIAVFGAQFGVWSPIFAFETLTMTAARYLALGGVGAAALAVVFGLRDLKRRGLFAAAAVALAGATLTIFLIQQARFAVEAPSDVSSDLNDVPGFSRLIQDRRIEAGAIETAQPKACGAAVMLPTQVAPEAAAAALKQAGFRVVGVAAYRAEGVRKGYWFGLGHDAVIRIRPRQTDVRVTAREKAAQGDEACRLAGAIVAALREAS